MSDKKKIFVLCATQQGLDLIKLINQKYKISYVITPKTNKYSSEERISAKSFCHKNKINCKEIKNYSNLDEIKNFLNKQKIDLLICVSWQRIIPDWVIKLPKIACLGMHGSHEGMYLGRGRSPMNWSILSGQKKFKMSLFKIQKDNADSGPEIYKKNIPITLNDDINSLYFKCHLILSEMIIKYLFNYKKITLKKYKGNHRFFPKITPKEGFVDWHRKDVEVYNFIKSKSSPYPNAFTFLKKKLIKIKSSKLVNVNFKNKFKCGEIVLILADKSFLVKTNNSFLLIRIYDYDFNKIKEGQILESTNFKTQVKSIINRHYKAYPKNKLNNLIIKLSR